MEIFSPNLSSRNPSEALVIIETLRDWIRSVLQKSANTLGLPLKSFNRWAIIKRVAFDDLLFFLLSSANLKILSDC